MNKDEFIETLEYLPTESITSEDVATLISILESFIKSNKEYDWIKHDIADIKCMWDYDYETIGGLDEEDV